MQKVHVRRVHLRLLPGLVEMSAIAPRITLEGKRHKNSSIEGRLVETEQIPKLSSDSAPHAAQPLAWWGRPLAVATAIVFCISSAFPVVAAFVKDTESWPKWWGVLDVGIAFFLALLAFGVIGMTQGRVDREAEQASYRAYRVLIHGVFVMLAVFVFFGDRIVWSNCLTGIAWRGWLLFYGLPAWFTAFGATAHRRGSPPA
jgi:hypothetical protein